MGHFCPSYKNTEDLQLQFGRQLDKIMLSGLRPSDRRTLSVSLLTQPSWRATQSNDLSYTSEERDGALLIAPRMTHLSQVDNGETVSGVSYWHYPFERKMPHLDVRLLNNGKDTVVVQEIEVDVRWSERIDRDLVFVRAATFNGVEFCNEGWANLSQVKLRMEFPGTPLPPVEMEPSDIGDRLWVPIEQNALKPERRHQWSQGDSPDRLPVEGVLSYLLGSTGQRRQTRFSTEIFLGIPQQGAPGLPSAVYSAHIQAGMAPQTIRIPCSQVVKAGDLERFLVTIRSDRWHQFRGILRLKLMDGTTIESREIDCEILVPRSEPRRQERERAESLSGLYEAEATALDTKPPLSALDDQPTRLLGSTAVQLRLLSELSDTTRDPQARRHLLRTIKASIPPSPLALNVLRAIVLEDPDEHLVDDALMTLVGGAFDPAQVFPPILSRAEGFRGVRDPYISYRCGLALWGYVAVAAQNDVRFEAAIRGLSDREAGVLLALGDLLAKLDVAKGRWYATAKARIEAAMFTSTPRI